MLDEADNGKCNERERVMKGADLIEYIKQRSQTISRIKNNRVQRVSLASRFGTVYGWQLDLQIQREMEDYSD